MSNGVQISIPMGDVDKLFKAMQYASDNLSIDMGKAMKRGVNALLNSIAASTKVAPKNRPVKHRPSLKTPRKDLKAFSVEGWFGKPRTHQNRIVYAKNLTNAKNTHGKISRRGLARLTWKLAAKDLANRFAVKVPTLESAITGKVAAEHIEAKSNYKGHDVYAEIHNSLPYINKALEGGPKTVDTAFDRAASGLIKSVDKQIERRLLKAA
jgi:hypothetical protein